MKTVLEYWRTKYDWRKEETRINQLPQYTTAIKVEGFDEINLHFVHSPSMREGSEPIPLLFVHGWPGSFLEVSKILPLLNAQGFSVIAPSLPGYGFSTYPSQPGFSIGKHATCFDALMQKLGYKEYVVQGGDWGWWIVRQVAKLFPQRVKAMHVNMVFLAPPEDEDRLDYTQSEKHFLERREWYMQKEYGYAALQATKPRNLGYALHDSPVGMLAWMADKLFLWTDDYPWTNDEIITWTLMHWFPGPTTALNMYFENPPDKVMEGVSRDGLLGVPAGVSAFPKELCVVPRSWTKGRLDIRFWREHERGGHFAAWERPRELVGDVVEFVKGVWEG